MLFVSNEVAKKEYERGACLGNKSGIEISKMH